MASAPLVPMKDKPNNSNRDINSLNMNMSIKFSGRL